MKKKSDKIFSKLLRPGIFSDPNKSRVLWHDSKVYGSASLIYLENMLDGVYGKLPKKLKLPLLDLQAAALIHLLTLENNSILNKLELNSLSLDPQRISVRPIIDSVIHFLKPLFEKKLIKVTTHFEKNIQLCLDRRYTSTLVQNMLVLAMEFISIKDKILFLKISKESIEIKCHTDLIQKELDFQISIQQIYNEKKEISTLPALLYLVNLSFAFLCSTTFGITIKNKTLTVKYGQH